MKRTGNSQLVLEFSAGKRLGKSLGKKGKRMLLQGYTYDKNRSVWVFCFFCSNL